jgi:hypothetical protein
MNCESGNPTTKATECSEGKRKAYYTFGLVVVFAEIIIGIILRCRFQCLALAKQKKLR